MAELHVNIFRDRLTGMTYKALEAKYGLHFQSIITIVSVGKKHGIEKLQSRKENFKVRGKREVVHPPDAEYLARLKSNVKITEAGCWEWQLFCNPLWGYGQMGYRGKQRRTHQLSWELHNGPIPQGMVVRHKCDNPPCCNPDHLELGTHRDNVHDRMRRGRDHHSTLTHCPKGHPYEGENLYVDPRGFRHCRTCKYIKTHEPEFMAANRERQRKLREKRKAVSG